MKAMIFAAGMGTRLGPFSQVLPKSLLPLRGRTVIEWILIRLQEAGVARVMINLHHLGEKIAQHLGDGSAHGLEIQYSREDRLLGTGGGLKKVEEFFRDGTFLALNSDMYFEIPLAPLVRKHREGGNQVTLVLKSGMETFLYGGVYLDGEGRVVGTGRSPGPGRRSCLFTGIQILEPGVFAFLSAEPSSVLPAYLKMAGEGRKVRGEVTGGRWEDLGTLANYLCYSSIP